MSIILCEAAHPRKPVKLAALLITVDRTEFREPQRQILVGTRLGPVYLTVVRAVHRLEQILLAFLRRMYRLE